jgi:hypothetical protein
MCHMPGPSHPPWYDHLNNILWEVQIMELLITEFSPSSYAQVSSSVLSYRTLSRGKKDNKENLR